MSQLIGQNFKTRIPEFTDDASIEEALKVYHYGVDNYTVEPIPDNSIEGHFRSLDSRIDSIESQIGGIDPSVPYVKFTSLSSVPNIIISETTSTIPLVVRAIASQTSSLQQWQNSSNSPVLSISVSGYLSTASYVGIGSITPVATTALNINVINPSNKGVVIRSAALQTANLQEWQNSSGSNLGWVDKDGSIYSKGVEVSEIQNPFFLMGA